MLLRVRGIIHCACLYFSLGGYESNEGPGDQTAEHAHHSQLVVVVEVGRSDTDEEFIQEDAHVGREDCVHKVKDSC